MAGTPGAPIPSLRDGQDLLCFLLTTPLGSVRPLPVSLLLLSRNSSEHPAPGNSDNCLTPNLEDKKEGCLMIVEPGVRRAASKHSIEKSPVGCSFVPNASESAETSLFLMPLKIYQACLPFEGNRLISKHWLASSSLFFLFATYPSFLIPSLFPF